MMKGEYNKECARTECDNGNAVYYHFSTQRYYCSECAMMLNNVNRKDSMELYGHELLVFVPHVINF
jgi:hypothetical protein